jgi:hypothetical protein
MSFGEAKDLIISEAAAITIMARMGDDPGAERMAQLIEALKILFDSLEGRTQIERSLAHSLFNLALYVPQNIDSWARNGRVWRKEFIEKEQFELISAIESIFEGKWLT